MLRRHKLLASDLVCYVIDALREGLSWPVRQQQQLTRIHPLNVYPQTTRSSIIYSCFSQILVNLYSNYYNFTLFSVSVAADRGATAVRALVVVRLVPVAVLLVPALAPWIAAPGHDHDPNPVIVDPKAHLFVVELGSLWTDLDPAPAHPVIVNPSRAVETVRTRVLIRAVEAGAYLICNTLFCHFVSNQIFFRKIGEKEPSQCQSTCQRWRLKNYHPSQDILEHGIMKFLLPYFFF